MSRLSREREADCNEAAKNNWVGWTELLTELEAVRAERDHWINTALQLAVAYNCPATEKAARDAIRAAERQEKL